MGPRLHRAVGTGRVRAPHGTCSAHSPPGCLAVAPANRYAILCLQQDYVLDACAGRYSNGPVWVDHLAGPTPSTDPRIPGERGYLCAASTLRQTKRQPPRSIRGTARSSVRKRLPARPGACRAGSVINYAIGGATACPGPAVMANAVSLTDQARNLAALQRAHCTL